MKSKIGIFSTISLLLLVGCGMRSPSAENTAAATNEGLPPGFELNVFAEGLGRARFMDFGPAYVPESGTSLDFARDRSAGKPDGWILYVGTNSRSGQVWALRDTDGDGRADQKAVFADGLSAPHSVFWREGWLYVGETHRVIRLRDTDGDLKADEREVVVADLPAWQQHFTRTVGFGPEGGLYVSVGSTCNVCEEDDPRRAAILRFEPDGSNPEASGEIYARGLRNSVGFTWHPETGEMWATNNGRDWLGDDLPPEELNLIQPGKDYGWPYCYSNRLPDPDLGSPERCQQTEPPAFEMQAHSAPLGLEFYTGEMFPEEYRGDLFIAFHGSWNRSVPTGYKVVRVRFKDGRPVGIEDFIGWLRGGEVKHRPVDVRTGPDGALYISDDRGGTIFRVTYSPAD